MINANRIVPVMATDLLSLYGLILKQDSDNSSLAALEAVNPGEFSQTMNSAVVIANEPVASFDFASGVSAGTVFFVAAYDYAGFTVNGSAATVASNGVTVNPDGATLYKAVLSSGTVTITQVGF